MLCVLFTIVVVLFNIAPITYIVFGIAIVSSIFLQYRRFKKQSISEKRHTQLAWCLYIAFTLSFSWLVSDWFRYDLKTSIEQFDSFEYSTMDWTQGWPTSGGPLHQSGFPLLGGLTSARAGLLSLVVTLGVSGHTTALLFDF